MSAPRDTDSKAPLLLLKWQAIGRALSDAGRLTYADVATLWQLMDRYNVQAGAAWPSLKRLAADTGRDRRTVMRSLDRLQAAGLVAVVQRGDRARQLSNRYRPSFAAPTHVNATTATTSTHAAQSGTTVGQKLHGMGGKVNGNNEIESATSHPSAGHDAKLGASAPLGLGASVTEARGAGVTNLGAPMPPEPIHEPGHKPGVMGGEPSAAASGAGAAGASPGAAPGRPANGGRQFGDFWAVYPKAQGVYAAEGVISDLLSGGEVTLRTLIDGARRYRDWLTVTPWGNDPKYIKAPANWLRARGWLDDYTHPAPKMPDKAPGKPQKATKKANGTRARSGRVAREETAKLA